MWIEMLEDDDHVITPRMVVAYREGMLVNAPHDYAEDAIVRGVAEAAGNPNQDTEQIEDVVADQVTDDHDGSEPDQDEATETEDEFGEGS